MRLRDRLLRFLRVPPPPDAPAAEEDTRTFRAAPGWLSYRRISWLLKQLSALAGLLVGFYFLRGGEFLPPSIDVGIITMTQGRWRALFLFFETVAWATFAGQAIGSFLLLRMDWEQRFYIVSDRSLRVREGIVRVHEKTTTFANIQQVSIRQGPLQRLFGIADVEVRSAGGGEGGPEKGDDLHTVHFRGVADAAGIRDTILRRVRRAQEQPAPAESALDRISQAAADLRAATRALPRPG